MVKRDHLASVKLTPYLSVTVGHTTDKEEVQLRSTNAQEDQWKPQSNPKTQVFTLMQGERDLTRFSDYRLRDNE